MTGITRISKESIFSDLNNLEVVTATSKKYESCFGFTEEKVWEALKEYGLYDNKKRLSMYWANTSSNNLVNEMIKRGSWEIKMEMENLLK